MSETPPAPQDPTTPNSVTPPAGPAASQTPPTGPMGDPSDVEKNKVYALLSYVGILWLVPLFAAKDSPFAKFHCNQGILLSIVWFVGAIAIGILSGIISVIPILRACSCFGCVVWVAFMVGILGLAIMGILNAVNGKIKPLPMFPVVNWVK